ncbi:unnamed protein product [Closterium sp. Yama58-4]|nr:unnamed protein product [Closterium sp. Yama58-4]
MNTGNMHLFDADGRMKKYDSPEEIIEDFYGIRLGYYLQRKEHQLAQLRHELLRLDNRARFVRAVIQGDVVITNRKQADIVAQLKARGFTPLPKGHAAAPVVVGDVDPGSTDVSADGDDVEMDDVEATAGQNLTWERVEQLERERKGKEEEVVVLEATSPLQLWERDLDLFLETLEEVEAEMAEEERERERSANQHKARGRNTAGRKGGKQQAGGASRGKKAGVTGGGEGGGGRGKAKAAVGETGIGDGGRQGGDRAQGGKGRAAAPMDMPTPRQSTPRHSSRLTRTQAAAAAPDAASPQQSKEHAGTDAQGRADTPAESDAEMSGGQGGGEQEQEDVDVNPSPPFPPPSPAAAAGMRESPPVIEMTSSEEEGGGGFGLQAGVGLRLGDSVSDAGDTSNTSSGNARNGDASNGSNSPSAASDPYSLHSSPSASPPLSTPLHASSTPNPPTNTATPHHAAKHEGGEEEKLEDLN